MYQLALARAHFQVVVRRYSPSRRTAIFHAPSQITSDPTGNRFHEASGGKLLADASSHYTATTYTVLFTSELRRHGRGAREPLRTRPSYTGRGAKLAAIAIRAAAEIRRYSGAAGPDR